jgi:glutamyl-tRNA synthetase
MNAHLTSPASPSPLPHHSTPVDQMRDERINKVESKYRNRPVEESLAAWEEMKKGSEEGLTTAMRFKIDMQV